MFRRSTICLAAMCGLLGGLSPTLADTPAAAQPASRMDWWRESRFGMFIHWGLYAVPAGRWDSKINTSYSGGLGEWLQHDAKIPVADYAKLAGKFNPTQFDADAWVSLAKSAGMKYIVITAKHHDGFAMFRTKVTPFNIVDATPFKRDPVAELAAACHKQGLRFGVYYSQAQDWHHPGGFVANGKWDPAQAGDYDAYLRDIAAPQVKELMSNYGPISVIWWDTPFDMTAARAKPLGDLLDLMPGIISNDRLGSGVRADYATPEQRIPANGYGGRDWETCMTINNTWGYKIDDHNFKSTKSLLHNLIDIASKGGNYLLNVGPTAEGIIPQPEADRLQEMGAWLKTNGEALYGTSAGPFRKQLPFGRATRRDNTLYLSVFDWPKDGTLTVPVSNKVVKAYLLASPQTALTTEGTEGGVKITVPTDAPDAIASVVVLQLDGMPTAMAAPAIKPAADGSVTLSAADASIEGSTAKLETRDSKEVIGYWTDPKDHLSWNFESPDAGKFDVELTYSCDERYAGSQFKVLIGDNSVTGSIESTGSWDQFKTVSVGQIQLTKPGTNTITIKPTKMPAGAVMNLQTVRLIPAK